LAFDAGVFGGLLTRIVTEEQLAQIALDVYATPAMSDEPERVFSMAGNLLSLRRRKLIGKGVKQMLYLRS
jgi:hypothetical protein